MPFCGPYQKSTVVKTGRVYIQIPKSRFSNGRNKYPIISTDSHSAINNENLYVCVTLFFLRTLILRVINIHSFWAVQNLIKEMPIYESINVMLSN